MNRKKGSTVLRIFVSLVLLVWIFWRIHPAEVLAAFQEADWRLIGLAWLIFQIGTGIRTLRWMVLLRSHGYQVTYSYLLILNYSGMFFNVFLPTGFGGDLVRMVEIGQAVSDQKARSAGIVILDRLLGFLALFTLCIIALPIAWRYLPETTHLPLVLIAWGGFLGLIVLIEGRLLRRFAPVLDRLPGGKMMGRVVQAITELPRRGWLQGWGISVIYQIIIILIHFTISRAYGADIPLILFGVFTPIVGLALLTPSIQGLGVRESVYSYLLVQVGVAAVVGVSISLSIYAINALTGLLGGFIYAGLNLKQALQPRPDEAIKAENK